MRIPLALGAALAVAIGTGCAGIEGIWLAEFAPLSEVDCQTTLTHNFNGVQDPDPGTVTNEWTFSVESESSGSLAFLQIVGDAEGAALVLGDSIWPGVEVDKDKWKFEWTSFQSETSVSQHESGYTYTQAADSESKTTLDITFDGDLFTGTLKSNSTDTATWTETDLWDSEEVGTTNGDIPAGGYLEVYDADLDDVRPARNLSEDSDCSASDCELEIVTTCSSTGPVDGQFTDYAAEDAFGAVENATQF